MKRGAILRVLFQTVLPALAALIGLALIVAWLAGAFTDKIDQQETIPSWDVATSEEAESAEEVHEVVKQYFHEAVGTLRAASRTEIAARIMAPILQIHVNAGGKVQVGDVLIELDNRQFQAKLDQTRSALEATQTAVAQAEKDYNRDAELFKERVIAEAQYEQSTTNLNLARSKYEQAKESVTEAEVMLSYTKIVAPQAGTVVDRRAEPGDIAQPGQTLLALYDPASLRLEVPVMENLALQLSIGDTMTVHVDALDEDVQSHVDEIVPQAQAASRSFLVKVGLPRSQRMFEGMFGRLKIPVGSRRHLCLVTAAIRTVGQLEFVEVVDLETRTKERRFITTGKVGMPGRIEVLSGLKAGDRVILPATSES